MKQKYKPSSFVVWKVPSDPVVNMDVQQFEAFVNKYAREVAFKISKSASFIPGVALNYHGTTIEDIRQELRLEVFMAILAWPKFREKHLSTIKNESSVFGGLVHKFLEDRATKMVRAHWAEKRGLNIKHVAGQEAADLLSGEFHEDK